MPTLMEKGLLIIWDWFSIRIMEGKSNLSEEVNGG